MTMALGVDTGGTYTDAVLVRDEKEIVASAKALTTRHDLAQGVGDAVRAVLSASGVDPAQIGLACLSTTLATNALVEGQGERVALVLIGFKERDLDTHGLRDALKGDPHIVVAGGHNHAGNPVADLDEAALLDFLETHKDSVSGFAVAAQFAVRNPAHELRAMELIADVAGQPVSASHQLSAKLGGPKRALTALLNARLVGMIDRLISRSEAQLAKMEITAPLMVVRGDGALISAAQAREKPIETILSGPAASIVGARWMTGAQDALVSDIGGTTTDVAVLRGGVPAIDPMGARVGPFRTMVEAVAMRTTGLGGDSEVHFLSEGLVGGVTLGPRRLLPVSLIAMDAPERVHAALDSQLRRDTPGEHDGRFVRAVPGLSAEGLGERESTLLQRIGTDIWPLGDALKSRLEIGALARLVDRGLLQLAGVTPSDAAHELGWLSAWDREAAQKALLLLGRRRAGHGNRLAPEATDMARIIIDQVTKQTVQALLETAFDEDDYDFGMSPDTLAAHPLMQAGLSDYRGLVRLSAGLNVPVIGLGASASSYYGAVGRSLGTQMILPEHAEVANAIGAVVGRVTMRRSGTVTAPSEGRYRVHLPTGPQDFADAEIAMTELEALLRREATDAAVLAGAEDLRITATRDVRVAQAEAREVFVEATVFVEASGRPRIAAG
ncbi:hydantoinase/oxoprolinase family protein [Aliishimia ponticola]|uniref:Hydantoinase/oxoprolinase family protein n=1 Tax=Aliishimia ponticola TaxID=2499833 RepID=A0A4S4NF91_9RHOB|nr:hydantoinase/oxoprolinase family protein [Aliishimia ponticola]THH34740.1 hydantoinase/oxoprolinase family protein [Aliishimia ponticola]